MYDKVYTYTDPEKQGEKKKKKVEYSFKDIFAMTIAAYQVLFVPIAIMGLAVVILYLIFDLLT